MTFTHLVRSSAVRDSLILCLLIVYSPAILIWMIVIDTVCAIRRILFAGADGRTAKFVRRTSIWIVSIFGAGAAVLNTAMIGVYLWPR